LALQYIKIFAMDSIKSKMKSLSEATAEATSRTQGYEDEMMRINDIGDKFEEQVNMNVHLKDTFVPTMQCVLC
jgi:hypothetical protein